MISRPPARPPGEEGVGELCSDIITVLDINLIPRPRGKFPSAWNEAMGMRSVG